MERDRESETEATLKEVKNDSLISTESVWKDEKREKMNKKEKKEEMKRD